jgi:hypothetical protein
MDTTDLLIIGGLGLLYFLTLPQSGYPQTYPASGIGTQPKQPGSGMSFGTSGGGPSGGSSGGGPSGGGPSGGNLPPGYQPAPGSGPFQGPPVPTDSMDPCDVTSSAYDPIVCTNSGGSPYTSSGTITPSTGGCPPVDSGDVCDQCSAMYDETACIAQLESGGTVSVNPIDPSATVDTTGIGVDTSGIGGGPDYTDVTAEFA